MKKTLSILLALCLCFSVFAACSSSSSETATTSPSSSTDVPADLDVEDVEEVEEVESDLDYIIEKGTLVVGMTDFAPMDYKDEGSDEWIGFDADMAKAFAEYLGVEIEFIEINWDNKLMELETKAIDCIWNGMTLTEEVMGATDNMGYCLNGQVVVVPADIAADYQDADSIADLAFAVENGSAGALELDAMGISYIAMQTQAQALMEVAAGASQACVIDLLMAGAMIGEGTSYPDLTYTVQLNSETYGVAFRQNGDTVDAFADFWAEAYADGTVMATAETYGVQESIIEQ